MTGRYFITIETVNTYRVLSLVVSLFLAYVPFDWQCNAKWPTWIRLALVPAWKSTVALLVLYCRLKVYMFCLFVCVFPIPSARQHSSYGDCLEVKREYCWFGHLACKNRPRNDLLCVECDVKPYTLTHSLICVILCVLTFVHGRQEEVIAGLDKVCGVLPSPLDKSCKDFVNEYVSTIINMIRQEVDPEQICSLLGLCSQYPVTEHGQRLLCNIIVLLYNIVLSASDGYGHR